MSEARNNVPLFVMGGIMIVYALIVITGSLLPLMKSLGTHKSVDLQVAMCFIVGILGILTGIVNSIRKPQNTVLDRFFLQPMADLACWMRFASTTEGTPRGALPALHWHQADQAQRVLAAPGVLGKGNS